MWRRSRVIGSMNALAQRTLWQRPLVLAEACHAERGAFTEWARHGRRRARTRLANPLRLIEACEGVGFVISELGRRAPGHPAAGAGSGSVSGLACATFLPWWPQLWVWHTGAGRVAAGLALAEHGVEQEVARGRPQSLASVVIRLSEAYLLAGRLEEARQRAAQAVDLARQYQFRGHQAWALWLLGESTAHQASPEVEPAVGHYRQSLALAEALGMRPLQAHCHPAARRHEGRPSRNRRVSLATAIALYRDMEMTFWLPQAEAVLAQVG